MAHATPENNCLSAQSICSNNGELLVAEANPTSNATARPDTTSDILSFESAAHDSIISGIPGDLLSFQSKDRARSNKADPIPFSSLSRRVNPLFGRAKSGILLHQQSHSFGRSPEIIELHGRVLREIQWTIGRKRRVSIPGRLSALIREQQKNWTGQRPDDILTSLRRNMFPRPDLENTDTADKENAPPFSEELGGTKPESITGHVLTSRRKHSAGSNRTRRRKSKESAPAFPPTPSYVEALEAEIASLHTRLSALSSPSIISRGSVRHRNMIPWDRMQRQEVDNWEHQFEERVKRAVSESVTCQEELQDKIRKLEDEMRRRDERCKLLEKQIRESDERARQAEQGEKLMSRRVDIFGAMVAGTSNRSTESSYEGWATAPATPLFKDASGPQKQLQHPRSMMMPVTRRLSVSASSRSTSPSRKRLSVIAVDNPNSWHQGIGEAEAIFECAQEPADDSANAESSSSLASDHRSAATGSTQPTSLDSTELRSPILASRPTSLLSNASFSASWGLPASLGRPYADSTLPNQSGHRSSCQPKRMRRFPSTSGGLKPLILPSTTPCTPVLPSSPWRRQTLYSPSRLGSISDASFFQFMSSPLSGPMEQAEEFNDSGKDAESLQTFVHHDSQLVHGKHNYNSNASKDIERLMTLRRLEGSDEYDADNESLFRAHRSSRPESWLSRLDVANEERYGPTSVLKERAVPGLPLSSNSNKVSSSQAKPSHSSYDDQSLESSPYCTRLAATPPRSPSPSLSETPKALEHAFHGIQRNSASDTYEDSNHLASNLSNSVKHFALPSGIEAHEPPLVSSFPFQNSSNRESIENSSLKYTKDIMFARLKDFTRAIFPRFDENRIFPTICGTRTRQAPVSAVRSLLIRLIHRSSRALRSMSPFRFGGLGWWLFGLLRRREKTFYADQGPFPGIVSMNKTTSITRDYSLDFTGMELAKKEHRSPDIEPLTGAMDEHTTLLGLGIPVEAPIVTITEAHHFSPKNRFLQAHNLCSNCYQGSDRAVEHAFEKAWGPDTIRCSSCVEPVIRRKLRVWAKLSLALILAIGVSILEGPESLLRDDDSEDIKRRC